MLQLVTRADRDRARASGDPRHAQRRLPARRCAGGAAARRSPAATSRSAWTARSWRRRCRRDARRRSPTLLRAEPARRDVSSATRSTSRCRCRSAGHRGTRRRRRPGRAHPALAHRAAALPAGDPHRARRRPRSSPCCSRRCSASRVARTITRPLAAITDVMREVAATGDLTRKIVAARRAALGRRRRAAAGDDVQHADRLDRALPARDVAEGAAVVARPAVDGHRARSAQSADDHQGVAAHAAAARRQRRRRVREAAADIDDEVVAAQPHRQRGARLRAADSLRARARRPQRALPRVGRRPRRSAPGAAGRRSSSTRRCRVTTDAERLRIALVNLLVNARHAVDAVDGRQPRPVAPVDASTTAAARPARRDHRFADTRRRHRRGRSRRASSIRTSRPSAAAPASACRSPRTSSKASAAPSPSPARRAAAPRSASTCRCTGPRGRGDADRTHASTAASILLVDDEEKILKALGRALRDAGHEVDRDAPARARRSGCWRAAVRRPHRRQRDAGAERPRPDPRVRRVDARRRAGADSDDDGARHRRERHRGDEARRARLPAEAVRDRRAAGRRPARARASAAAHRVPLPAQRARRAVRPLRHHRPQPRDAGHHPARRAGRRNQEHGAHHRRDRHRQGAGGARDPRPQRAARHAAHQGQLRGHSRDAARVGALRPRPRRVHRRDHAPRRASSRWPTAARSSSTRSAR